MHSSFSVGYGLLVSAFLLCGWALPSASQEPTLARLSFWVPSERRAEFAALFQVQLLPLLEERGLVVADQAGRATVDSVFSRLFAFASPDAFLAAAQDLQGDAEWNGQLRRLGGVLGAGDDTLVRHTFNLYRWPVLVRSSSPVLPEFRQGLWQTYNILGWFTAFATGAQGRLWFSNGDLVVYDGHTATFFAGFEEGSGGGNSGVYAIVADDQGLWLGTSNGLVRYNGQTFTRFTTADGLVHNAVGQLLLDRRGTLWIGTGIVGGFFTPGGGLSRWDGDTFVNFTTADGLADNTVFALFEDKQGGLWCGTRNGLNRFDGSTWQTFTTVDGLAHNTVSGLVVDRHDNLWIGTGGIGMPGGGLSRWDGEAFTTFTTADGLAHNSVTDAARDLDGHLWFTTSGGGISRWDGRAFTNFTTRDGLCHNQLRAVLVDAAGNVWTGGQGGGISRWSGGQFANFTTADGFPNAEMQAIAEDRQEHLWFGAHGSISRYDGEQFTHFTGADIPGLAHRIKRIVEDEAGHMWFATEGGGAIRYDGQAFKTFTTENGLPYNYLFSAAKDRAGNLWFVGPSRLTGAEAGGAIRYNGHTFEHFEDDETIWNAMVDRSGLVWLARSGEPIIRYDGGHFADFNLPTNGADEFFPLNAFEDRHGGFWFNSWGEGVLHYDGQAARIFTIEDGLPKGPVLTILEDSRNHTWFGSYGGGIGRYDGAVFQSLSRRDGLPSDQVQQVYQNQPGIVWIATEDGLTRYRVSTEPPSIHFTDVSTDQRLGPLSQVRLSSLRPFVAFEFQGSNLATRSDGFVYVYRLLGRDEEWQTTRDKRVEYGALQVGDYRFEVKAVDHDLNYSEPAAVQVEVYAESPTLPVRLEAVQLEDIFASYYPSYAHRPLGSVQVVNDDVQASEITLRLWLPELMRRPFEKTLVLPPQSRQAVELVPQLDADILHMRDRRTLQAEIEIEFERDGQVHAIKEKPALALHGVGALRWDSVARAAAFITSTDSAVVAFARPPLVEYENRLRSLGTPGHNLLQAALLFEALK